MDILFLWFLAPAILAVIIWCVYCVVWSVFAVIAFPFMCIWGFAKSIKEGISFRWSCRNDSIPPWYPLKEDYETYRIRNGLPEWPNYGSGRGL
jgi:hypothetical protein